MVLGWLLGLGIALADDGALTAQQVALAEWSRDLPTLLAGRYDDALFPQVARALGRLRDPGALDRLTLLSGLSAPAVREESYVALGTTPGGAAVLRSRLVQESDPGLIAVALRALGRCGDAQDVAIMVDHLAASEREASAGALGLGLLARRGVDVSAAVPTLVGLVDTWPSARAPAAAYALYRAQPVGLSPVLVRRLSRAYGRTPDDATRGWLVPVLVANLDAETIATWRPQVLNQPYRLAKVALLATSNPLAWTEDELRRLATSSDPWVAMRVAERAPLGPPADEADDARRALTTDTATDAQIQLVLDQAVGDASPVVRSTSAAALLSGAARPDVLDALETRGEPAVIELLAEHLAAADTPSSWTRLERLALLPLPDASMAVVLRALTDGGAHGRRPGTEVVTHLEGLVSAGHPGVASAAHALLDGLGRTLPAPPHALPGPAGLERELSAIGRLRSAVITTTQGSVVVALEPETAPLAVATFAWLAEHGFDPDGPYAQVAWTSTAFHRVVPGFVVQAGDPRGDGLGGPGWLLPDETSGRPFVTGALGMATSGPDEGGSQWFITTSPQPHLVGGYTRFGVVTQGLDVVQRLDSGDRVLGVVIERSPLEDP